MMMIVYKYFLIYKLVLELGGVVFDSVLGGGAIPPPTKEILLEIRGGNVFTA